MRLRNKYLSLACAGVLVLAACGGGDEASGDEASGGLVELGEGEGAVKIVAWAGYVEDGSTDPNVDWVSGFEAETGCQVNVKIGNSSDEMVELMQSGEYDVVSASGDATLRLIAGGDVAPVNTDLIPKYWLVFDDLKNRQWNSIDGVAYGVPHGRAANVMVYNTEAGAAPYSLRAMFEPDSPYAGKISVYDSPIYIADAALYLMATQPDLGITNPYALDQTQFDAAIAALEAQKAIVGQYWTVDTDQQASLEAGSVTLGTSLQMIANSAIANGAKIAVKKPIEGVTGRSDTWMISSKAKNPNCAYMWLNHIISDEVNYFAARWLGEAPSNKWSIPSICGDEYVVFCQTSHGDEGETDYWRDVWFWTAPTSTCLDGRDVECVPYTEWVNAWKKLRA